MKSVVFICLLLPATGFADCIEVDSNELIKGAPVVKVAPMYPRKAAAMGIEGCVVLGYGLKERPGMEGRGLIPTSITVLSKPSEHSRAFSRAAKRALEKWLFLSKTHEPSQNVRYYSPIPFQLVDETQSTTE